MVDCRPARADDGEAPSRPDGEREVVQDRATRVVGEADACELHCTGTGRERHGVRRVGDIRGDVEQAEHGLHVGQGLLDLAVHETEEIERHEELDQVGVDQHEITDRERAGDDPAARHAHQDHQADADDGGLTNVEQGQRQFARHGRFLVAREGFVEAPCLPLLVAEILDGFVVQQAVDGPRVGLWSVSFMRRR